MQEIIQNINCNKEWIFSGIGVLIISTIIGIIFNKKGNKDNKNVVKINSNKMNDIIINSTDKDEQNSLYKDLLQKPIIQVGDAIESTMKFVALPFKFLGMTSDELEKRYREFITESVSKIPKNKINKPSPLIAAKLLDNVKYSFNENDRNLTKMFSDLLSSSMNCDTQKYIHPSYVDNLSNMNYVDGYVCKYLFENGEMRASYFLIPYYQNPIIHDNKNDVYMSMQPTYKISYDNYRTNIGIQINDEQLELSLSFLKSIDVISVNKETFLTAEEYIKHIKTMLSRYNKYDFPHKSGFFEYIFNNYAKKEVDYQYNLNNAISFIPKELNKDNDEKFCEIETKTHIKYDKIQIRRTTIKLTEYGYKFLKNCILNNKNDVSP